MHMFASVGLRRMFVCLHLDFRSGLRLIVVRQVFVTCAMFFLWIVVRMLLEFEKGAY